MKITSLITTLALLTTSLSFAGGEGWMHDFEAAKKKAAAENKDLLVDFTGSDWCGWCIKLNEEVFQHDPFKKGIAENYILVELDYPRDKSKMDEATIAQNEKLQASYAIKGFPSILLMDAQGRPYAKTGYQKGGPEAYLKHLSEIQNNKKELGEELATARKSEGLDKAKALFAILAEMPEGHASHYVKAEEEIIKNDPEDVTGFTAKKNQEQAMFGLETGLQTAMEAGKTNEALALVDSFITIHKVDGEKKQEILSIKFNILMKDNNFEAAEKLLDEIVAVDPESQYGKGAASFKPRLEKMKVEAADKE